MDFSAAIETLYRLNTGVVGTDVGRHERPHKPVLLLAVFDALASGNARPDRVEWGKWLRERFRVYFEQVRSHDDDCSPEFPFFHLKGDGFWSPVSMEPTGESPLAAPPKARDLDSGRVFARFVDGWDMLVANPLFRTGFRDATCLSGADRCTFMIFGAAPQSGDRFLNDVVDIGEPGKADSEPGFQRGLVRTNLLRIPTLRLVVGLSGVGQGRVHS